MPCILRKPNTPPTPILFFEKNPIPRCYHSPLPLYIFSRLLFRLFVMFKSELWTRSLYGNCAKHSSLLRSRSRGRAPNAARSAAEFLPLQTAAYFRTTFLSLCLSDASGYLVELFSAANSQDPEKGCAGDV